MKSKKPTKKRNLPQELTTVTRLSKTLAVILFLALPFVGFFIGMQYQQAFDAATEQNSAPIIQYQPVPSISPTISPTR